MRQFDASLLACLRSRSRAGHARRHSSRKVASRAQLDRMANDPFSPGEDASRHEQAHIQARNRCEGG
eukprot:6895192-Prymnesium_polylepis.3